MFKIYCNQNEFDRNKLNSSKNFIFEMFDNSMAFWSFSYSWFYILSKIQGEQINDSFGIAMITMLLFFGFNLINNKKNFILPDEIFRIKEFYY